MNRDIKPAKNVKPVLALLSEGTLETEFGEFKMTVFHDGESKQYCIRLNQPDKKRCYVEFTPSVYPLTSSRELYVIVRSKC